MLFGVLTAGGLWVIVVVGTPGGPPLEEVLGEAGAWPLAAAAALALLDIALGGSRLWVLAHHLHPGFRWRDGLRAHLYNVLASGLTPLQAGGGPAQYFVLTRAGLRDGRAAAVLTATWVGTMAGYLVLGSLAVAYLLGLSGGFGVSGVFRGLFATFGTVALTSLLAIASPRSVERLLLTRGWARRSPGRRRLLRAVGRYRRAVGRFLGTDAGRRAWAGNVGLSWAKLVTRCFIGVAVLAALGVGAGTLPALARLMLQYAVVYVSPGPGGSGVAELSALGFMAGVVPPALMAAYALLWRAASAYLGIVLAGSCVAVDVLRGRLGRRGAAGEGAPGAAANGFAATPTGGGAAPAGAPVPGPQEPGPRPERAGPTGRAPVPGGDRPLALGGGGGDG